ncbi:MAG: polyprenyl synthetase family protein [Verrucomicrobiae bacterium]|nr:polyprenyl synthetase family protein [Verrucomicrobiae bacterium]
MLGTRIGDKTQPPPNFEGAEWRDLVEPLQPFLRDVVEELEGQVERFDPEIAAYTRYALTNQGKHLRPVLLALSGRAIGPLTHDHVRVATIVEMIHLATLVHDDIMDEARVRRKRPTLAANWGNQISVLVGDCLFAHALTLAASFPTPVICRNVAQATNTVCSGEVLQTHRQLNFEVTREEYFKVISMKTAELFGLSCHLGGMLSGGGEAEIKALRDFGMALGTAYQIYDDCVDVFGNEASAGKSLGTDLASGKMTLPILILLESVESADRARLEEWIRNWRPHYFERVAELMARHNILRESQRVLWGFLEQGGAALRELPDSEETAALSGLLRFLGRQTVEIGAD